MSLRRTAFAIAAATLVVAFTCAATYVAAQPQEKVIKVSAKRFDYTPRHLTLKKGEPVILELTTADVLMGFNAPDLGVRADILPDKVTRVRVVPDKTGTFTFLCDIFCGTKHEEMNGTITVVD
jgi:cytochrome c oxidase subunit 2